MSIKQKDLQGQGPSNITRSLFVYFFVVTGFPDHFPPLTLQPRTPVIVLCRTPKLLLYLERRTLLAVFADCFPKPCHSCMCSSFFFLFIGKYTIDPNEGCTSDAVEVYCDFEKQANCVNPKKSKVLDFVCCCFSLLMWIFSELTSTLLLISLDYYRSQRNRTWTMDKRGRTGKSCLLKPVKNVWSCISVNSVFPFRIEIESSLN